MLWNGGWGKDVWQRLFSQPAGPEGLWNRDNSNEAGGSRDSSEENIVKAMAGIEGKSLNCVFTCPPAPPSQECFHCINHCALIRASRCGVFCIRVNLSSLLSRTRSPAERLEV